MSNIGVATNKTIIQLYNDINDKNLVLQPEFQRKLVWNNRHKENFIDTILKGYPFPEVYFADGEIDLETKKVKTLVVDGQQRLHTIYQFITNSSDLVLQNTKRFNELNKTEKENFLYYTVVVRSLGRIDIEEIKEIFKRINSVQYALNAMEINNALYEGEFIKTAKEVANLGILKDMETFAENEIERMKDIEFILLIMATVEIGGYFTGNREIEALIKKNDDTYPDKDIIKKKLVTTLSLVKQLHLPIDAIWYRKSSLFTLITELTFFYYDQDYLPSKESIEKLLIELEKSIIQNKHKNPDNNKYSAFYSYIFQGTTSRKGRVLRGEVLEKAFKSLIKG